MMVVQQQYPPVVLTTNKRRRFCTIKTKKKNTVYYIVVIVLLLFITTRYNFQLFHDQLSANDFLSSSSSSSTITTTTTTGNNRNNDHHHHQNTDVIWEWQRYHDTYNQTTGTNTTTIKRGRYSVLIAQYDAGVGDRSTTGSSNYTGTYSTQNTSSSSNNSYTTILNLTRRINQLYAKHYQFDYVLLRGIIYRTWYEQQQQQQQWLFSSRTTSGNTATMINVPQSSRATYNKVYILQTAILKWKDQYDYLLLLDSDAMMYDFTRDISELLIVQPPPTATLPPQYQKMIVAHPVGHHPYYNINIGVTLWNLHHPFIRTIVRQWNILCWLRILMGKTDNDQKPLQTIFRYYFYYYYYRDYTTTTSMENTTTGITVGGMIQESYTDFAYHGGTFIRHYIRTNSEQWISSTQDNEQRIQRITRDAQTICQQYQLICE